MTFKELRTQKGFDSQKALAYEIGVTRSTVSMWDLYGNMPEIKTLLKLKNKFCISLDDLVDCFLKTQGGEHVT